jgi:hypothetical protein
MNNDEIIVLNLIAEDPEDTSEPASEQPTDVARGSIHTDDPVIHDDAPQQEAERSTEHVTRAIMEATSPATARTHKKTSDEGTVEEAGRQSKPKASLPNRLKHSDEAKEPFTRDKRLCTPFKVFLEKASMGQRHQIPKQHPAFNVPEPEVMVGLDPVMHVWDIYRSEADHPTLYKVGLITAFIGEDIAEVTFYKSTYQKYGMWEDAPRRSEWARAIQTKAEIPIAQLAVMYVGNHQDWNCMMRKIKNMAAQARSITENAQEIPLTTDEIEAWDEAGFHDVNDLHRKSRALALQRQTLANEWVVAINMQAEKLIRIWNDKTNKDADVEGLWYQLTHIVNDLDWTNRAKVASYSKSLTEGFKRYVVPIEFQFRIGKLLILLTNIIAEFGHDSWNAVFNPYCRKTSLSLNALIHDEFVLDSRKPLIDEFGRLIAQDNMQPFHKANGSVIVPQQFITLDPVGEREHDSIEDHIQKYHGQPADIFTRLNLVNFELGGAPSSPDYYGNRILLDEASSIVYRSGGYIAAPHNQRIEVDHQRLITLVCRMNDVLYSEATREGYPYEEKFLLPISRESFPAIFEEVKFEYDSILEESEFRDKYCSPYSMYAKNTQATNSPRKVTSPGRTSRTSRRAADEREHARTQRDGDTVVGAIPRAISTKAAASGSATVPKARITQPTAPEKSDDPEAIRHELVKLQKKYDKQAGDISLLKAQAKAWESHMAQANRLLDEQTADLDASYRREDTYARLLTFLKARDHRLNQTTTTAILDSDVQVIRAALSTEGHKDLVKWIRNELSPESILTRVKEDKACSEAIKSEADIMRTILENPVPRPETRVTLQELAGRYTITTTPAAQITNPQLGTERATTNEPSEGAEDSSNRHDPGTEPSKDAKLPAIAPTLLPVTTTAEQLPHITELLDDDSDSIPSKENQISSSTGPARTRIRGNAVKDIETPISRILSEVETINTRFHGTHYQQADPIEGDEINNMPNEQIKDLFRILVTTATRIQDCDIVPTGPDDPDRERKRRDASAVAFQHLTFLMELITLGISHLLKASEKFPGGKLVYSDNAKAYVLKAGIDKYLFTRFTTHTQGVDRLRTGKTQSDASYMKCLVWYINIYVGWVLAMTKIPLHMITTQELRPALTINREMSPKVREWFRELIRKSTSISEPRNKRGSVTVYTSKKTLKPWARFLPILNIACSVPEDTDYTSTLLAQKNQEHTGGTRKRVGIDDRVPRKKKLQRRALDDSGNSDASDGTFDSTA